MANKETGLSTMASHEEIHTGVQHVDARLFSEKVPTKHDDALDFLRSTGDQDFTYTDHDAVKVRWKIDFLLMPLVCNKCGQGSTADMACSFSEHSHSTS